jgi:hypothetical protein
MIGPSMTTLIEINASELLAELVASLRRSECIVEELGERTCRVIHGDVPEADHPRSELVFFLRAWAALYPGVEVRLVT